MQNNFGVAVYFLLSNYMNQHTKKHPGSGEKNTFHECQKALQDRRVCINLRIWKMKTKKNQIPSFSSNITIKHVEYNLRI